MLDYVLLSPIEDYCNGIPVMLIVVPWDKNTSSSQEKSNYFSALHNQFFSSVQFYDYSWYGSVWHIINIQRLFPRCIQHLYTEGHHRLSRLHWVSGANTSSTSNGTSFIQAFPFLGTHILGLCGIALLDASPDTSLCLFISPLLQHMLLGWRRRDAGPGQKSVVTQRFKAQTVNELSCPGSFTDCMCQCSWNN